MCNDKSGNNGNIDTFVWYHDGQLLVNKTNILTFENADLSIAGEYKCTARNVAGTDSAGVKIIVKCKSDTCCFTLMYPWQKLL